LSSRVNSISCLSFTTLFWICLVSHWLNLVLSFIFSRQEFEFFISIFLHFIHCICELFLLLIFSSYYARSQSFCILIGILIFMKGFQYFFLMVKLKDKVDLILQNGKKTIAKPLLDDFPIHIPHFFMILYLSKIYLLTKTW
jgi:hypothetical protein